MRIILIIFCIAFLTGPLTAQTRPSSAPSKPWLDDWMSFVNSDSNHRWIRGDSARTALSAEEAVANACTDAANELLPLVRSQMSANAAGRASIRVADSFVLQKTTELLVNGTAVQDRFVQRFDRSYGQIWQASVLIDASPRKIEAVARSVADQARADYQEKLASQKRQALQQTATWGSLAAFLAVIVVLYWFLNAATKGYFTWRLRFGAVTLIAFGILWALLFITMHMPRALVVRP